MDFQYNWKSILLNKIKLKIIEPCLKLFDHNYDNIFEVDMRIKLISLKMTLRPMDSEFKRAISPSVALLILASCRNWKYG
jgi:hypothetical protein